MKLSIAVGASLVAALAASVGVWRLDLMGEPPWAVDALNATLAATGGPGGLCPLLYAVLSCALLTAGALHGLGALGTALAARAQAEPRRLPETWRATLEGTEFAPLAGPITGDELAIAPLALLRVLRAEIWRIFIKRVVASQTVTVALAAVALAFAPDLAPIPTVGTAVILRIDALAAGVVFAGGIASALLLDRAIERFATLVTRLSAAWEEALPPAPAPVRAAALPQPRIAERPSGPSEAQIGQLTASVDRLAALVASGAERQNETLADFSRLMADGIETLTRALDRAEATRATETATANAALAQLTAAIEQLVQPVRDQMKVLAASDRRLITMLRRQEEVAGSLGQRWSELVTALQSMSEGLVSAAVAAREDAATRLSAAALGEGLPASGLENELQDLLDEMSEPETPEDDPGRLRG